ncbi:TRAM domain-containing protein [Paenibacillus larvae]
MKENLEYNQQKEQTNSKKRDKKWINPQNHVKSGDFPGNKRKNHDKRKIRKKKDDRPNRSVRTVSSAEDIRPGDRIVVTIKRIGINGEGVGYYKRKAVFIPGAITGEVVKAQVTKVQSGYLEAKPSEIEKSSPDRQIPPCPVFDQCGGCQLQHMTYSSQLAAKEEIVRESFRRYLGDNAGILIRPIRGMDHPWDYRNKAQLQTEVRDSRVITGLYTPGTHHLVDISGCLVQDPVINHVMQVMK